MNTLLSKMLIGAMPSKTIVLVLMIVLIVFIALLVALAIVFITVLRKRTPVVKVVMAPPIKQVEAEPMKHDALAAGETAPAVEGGGAQASLPESSAEQDNDADADDEEDDDDSPTYVTEGQERVRYDRSMTAKLCQLKKETKEWYTELKNELLSYDKVKDRMSWKRETYRIGRMAVARIVVRGKTLCLLLAVEPAGYNGTKYTVEDVSNVANTVDTPTLFRIKSDRRLKYAKEMIAGLMKELKSYKDPRYEAQDYFTPYEGDMALMQRGLVKRIVSGTTRTFKIEEVDAAEAEAAAANDEKSANGDKA